MQPQNSDAPGRAKPQGVRIANKAKSSRPNSTTKRYRLPSNWRDRLPDSASVYRAKLKDLSPPDRDGWATARCPFHEGSELSLMVDLACSRGGWRCRGCGAHGDLITFVREIEGVSFQGAVRTLMDTARQVVPSANAAAHIQRCRALLQEGVK